MNCIKNKCVYDILVLFIEGPKEFHDVMHRQMNNNLKVQISYV